MFGTIVLQLSTRITAIPISTIDSKDISTSVTSVRDVLGRRAFVHLTSPSNWNFQLGAWTVNFLSTSVFPTFQDDVVNFYEQVMDLTAPGPHQTPQSPFFRYSLGRLQLTFQSLDGNSIAWPVIYAFAAQAIARANRGMIGTYRGVSVFLAWTAYLASLPKRIMLANLGHFQNLLNAAGQAVAFRLAVIPPPPPDPNRMHVG